MKAAAPITALLAALALAGTARAEDTKPICADRPTKGTAPCTVDPGRWQVEIDAADYTHDRSGGVTTETGVFAIANLKYGVSDRLDLELNLTPLQFQQASGQGRAQGFGDITLRAKLAVLGGANPVSLVPYLKVPTAGAGLGNGAVEGGMVVPISIGLPAGTTLSLDPEIDALKDQAASGLHPAYALAAGLSHPLSQTLTGTVELWGEANEEPAGHVRQASFDLGLSWIPMKDQNLQLDGGINLGLNRQTPGEQVYVGLSRRF
jgi:hypothetical protein